MVLFAGDVKKLSMKMSPPNIIHQTYVNEKVYFYISAPIVFFSNFPKNIIDVAKKKVKSKLKKVK